MLVGGIPRTYPLADLVETPVLNDSIGEFGIVIVTEPDLEGPPAPKLEKA